MSNSSENHSKCIIIGSGPAGYTAAIYAARADLEPTVITGLEHGGQLMFTTDVENYPGYPDGRTGPEMMEDFRKQAERFGTKIIYQFVNKVDLASQPKKLWTDDGTEYTADTVIISTGASAKWLNIESEQRLRMNGGGVSACAVCDGFFYKGLDVAVVGAGDSAAEEATYLAGLCKNVHLLVRRDEMRASKIMQQRVFDKENIEVHWDTQTKEVLGDDQVTAVRVENVKTKEIKDIPIQGFFLGIGHKPNTDLFKGQLDMDDVGYLITEGKSTHTNIEGVYAAGDVQDSIYRQAVSAAGTGCMAALDAERWLKEKGII